MGLRAVSCGDDAADDRKEWVSVGNEVLAQAANISIWPAERTDALP